MKLEKISDKTATEAPADVLLERDDTDVMLDIMSQLNAAPEDTNWTFTVCRINTDANGVAVNHALEPQLLEGDASVMEGLPARLRDEFGTGRYRVRVLANKRLVKRFDIAVERPAKASAPAQPQSEMATVLAAMGKQNEQIIALLSRPQTLAVAPVATDPVAMFKACLDMVKHFAPAPVAPVAPVNGPEHSVELILKGVELAERVGGGEREKGMMDIISDLLQSPIVTEIAKNMTGGGMQPPLQLPPLRTRRQVAPPAPQANGKDTPPIPPAPEATAPNPQVAEMRKIIHYLLARAQSGSSVETYAEWAFDSLPPAMIDGMLAQPQLVDIMQGIVPEIAPHRDWFVKVVDELRLLVNDANAAQEPSPDVSGYSPSAFHPNVDAGREGGGTGDIEDDE